MDKHIGEGLVNPFSNMRFMNEVVENRLIMEDSHGNKAEIIFRPGYYEQAVDLGCKELIRKQKEMAINASSKVVGGKLNE